MNKIKKWSQMVFVRNFDTINSYYNRRKVNALSNKCIVTLLLQLFGNNQKTSFKK